MYSSVVSSYAPPSTAGCNVIRWAFAGEAMIGYAVKASFVSSRRCGGASTSFVESPEGRVTVSCLALESQSMQIESCLSASKSMSLNAGFPRRQPPSTRRSSLVLPKCDAAVRQKPALIVQSRRICIGSQTRINEMIRQSEAESI